MKLPSLLSIRGLNALAFLSCVGLLSYAAYLQFEKGLEPCPLCIIQRAIFFVLAILFLIGAIHRASSLRGHRYFHAFIFIVATSGVASASRQVWLQYGAAANKLNSCGPGLGYMVQNFPLWDTLKALLIGSGDCAHIQLEILGLSIPVWTLLAFSGFAILAFISIWRKPTRC